MCVCVCVCVREVGQLSFIQACLIKQQRQILSI